MTSGLIPRVAGVVRRPRSTLTHVVSNPSWAGLLLLLTALTCAANAAVFSTEAGQQALVDQWERTALAFGEPVDDARYAELQDLSRNGPAYGVLSALANGPLVAFGVAAAIYVVFRRSRAVTFRQVLAVAVHAGVILTVRQLVAAPATYARETTASAMTVGRWFPMFDEASPAARFFGVLDLFVIWWAVVLAIGVAVLYGRRSSRLALAFIGVYALFALILAATMAVLGGGN